MIREGIRKAVERIDLSHEEARAVMSEIMTGAATGAQIGAFLAALRMKGESVDEISAFAESMREHSIAIRPRVTGRIVDTCGTGGGGIKTVNVSTIAAFITAGAGIPVAKHGNRSVTSACGSADLLERFGLDLGIDPQVVERCIGEVGIGFLFAPTFHPAMKHASAPRKEIGIRTIFNILGPLCNPAGAQGQVIGVPTSELVEPMARVLGKLGCQEAMVVHGLDGLDEISTIGRTKIAWLRDGEISVREVQPENLGVKLARPSEVEGGTGIDDNVASALTILSGREVGSPKAELVLVNAAAAMIVGGRAVSFPEGLAEARRSLEGGQALRKLREMISFCRGDLGKLEELESRFG